MPERYLDPKTDLTFKKVFGEHENLVMSLLNALLPLDEGEEITHVEYLTPEMLPETEKHKLSIVDVRCHEAGGRTFLVEMQLYYFKTFFDRVFYNASKSYSQQSAKAMRYSELQRVYSLNIVNDVIPEYKDDWRQDWFMTSQQEPTRVAKNICLTFIQLPNFKPQTKGMKKLAELWLSFLTAFNGDEMPHISPELLENEETSQAIKILRESAYTAEEMYKYDRYWDAVTKERSVLSDFYNQGKAEGKLEGKLEGMLEGKLEVASNLRSLGMTPDVVSKATGLSEEEIQQLK